MVKGEVRSDKEIRTQARRDDRVKMEDTTDALCELSQCRFLETQPGLLEGC